MPWRTPASRRVRSNKDWFFIMLWTPLDELIGSSTPQHRCSGVLMRARLVFAFGAAIALTACGSPGGPGPGGDDDTPDAGGDPPPANGFRIVTPDIDIQPGQEITYCYYFRTPNTKMLGIKRWKSEMTPGSHHMIMFTTGNTDVQPVGTVSSQNCGGGAGIGGAPVWTYAAQTPTADLRLPADDGTGKPLGMDVAPNTAAYLQMHYLNTTDAAIKVHVTLDAEAHDDAVAYTKTAAYVTFYGQIKIPALAQNHTEPRPVPPSTELNLANSTCDVPAGSKFWLMSTHAHKQAVHTEVRDGGAMVFQSDDWEHPIPRMQMAAPFFEFQSGKLTYLCRYTNPTNREIKTGDSAATDEMCMASGYFFPATKPVFCFNNIAF
ncbi:MAG: hypothetical protein KF773_10345 [Deltaproteobacteria bacterium]|nr:hypothetical protein [Deltaproteobacteria bacterium]